MSSGPLPPRYSPAPQYSPFPKSTERTLQRASTAGPSWISPNGYFVKRNDDITLLLHGQDGSKERPCIGPGARLEGRIIVERTDREKVRGVEFKIDGLLESLPLPGAHSTAAIVGISNSLYSSANDSCCPGSLPFSHRFPSIYEYEDDVYLLPPTCHINFYYPQLFVKCTYRITAIVLIRHHMPPFFRKEHRVSIELDYYPQPIHYEPILQNPSFLATVKQCPEEWTQLPITPEDSTLDLGGLACDLVVPSSRVFCISDAIPFHIHLSGSVASLRELFGGDPGAFTHPLHSTESSPIRVYILRRITMRVGDRNARRSLVLGEGRSQPLPPIFHEPADHGEHTLHWEGEARCTDDDTVGSFDAGFVVVKDTIVAEISPPRGSSLRRATAEYPIKLTANGWNAR